MVARSLLLASLLATTSLATGCASETSSENEPEIADEALTMGNRPWDDQAEEEWGQWVAEIGAARIAKRCIALNDCINDAAINKLRKATDTRLDIFADCADVPHELRAYFAIKTGRPFQWVSAIRGAQYTPDNAPTSFSDARAYPTMQRLLTAVSQTVHSGHYRMRANVEASDTYPVDVTRQTIKPGTVYYDPNGHVLLVVKVEPDGTIRMIDGHPDNSLTTQIFGEKFAVGGASQGGGFRRFRPYTFTPDGASGGTFTRVTNDRLTGSKFGLGEQQYGRGQGYYPWVRERLSNGAPLDPVQQMRELSAQLCTDLQDRAVAVTGAARVANGPLGPVPPNIYGAEGEWEALSTPSRDARFKAAFRGLRRLVDQYAKTGTSTARAMGTIWRDVSSSCAITYTGTAGAKVRLTLGQVETRLFDLSFDPYHCPEMRWGAHPSFAQEMASCRTSPAHLQRFEDERTQRNAVDREYGAPTPFGWGPPVPEDVNVTKLLERRGAL
ncbi:MAG: hypothetical protein JST00_09315 [Deltaproteobacteria bacterium]|nr:hypothetical protein [Deltaproteobacteria bacterium]